MRPILNKARGAAVAAWRGTHHGAEYLCVAEEPGLYRPQATLGMATKGCAIDVTATWLLVGIVPVVIAVPVPIGGDKAAALDGANDCVLTLTDRPFVANTRWHGCVSTSEWLARLRLRRVSTHTICGQHVHVFEATHGRHRLLGPRARLGIVSHDRFASWRRGPADRVDPLRPEGNRYDQLRIGYATARPVLAATVMSKSGSNTFPIDLQGPLGSNGRLVSLREGAKVGEQIGASKSFAVSTIAAQGSAWLYGLGRNHMAALQPFANGTKKPHGDCDKSVMKQLLPPLAVRTELVKIQAIETVGLHRLHLCEVRDVIDHTPAQPTVAHLHLWYAMWLDQTGRTPRYLQRG
jgi:hypothetical protein